jgi:transcriptional regulator of acetoin/glycerol metabolism
MSDSAHIAKVLACVRAGAAAAEVSTVVAASWRRCVSEYRLEPHRTPQPKILTAGELKDFRAPLDDLIGLARDEIDRLFARIGPQDYVVLLSDGNGVTVDTRCGSALIGEARRNGLYEGAIWAEAEQGANGVGTCLHEARPLSIVMDEHFSVRNTALTCTVAPIFGPGGSVLGVLDVSTARPTNPGAQAIVREIVAAAARRIENVHFARRNEGRRVLRLSPGRDFVDAATELRIALGDDGRIVEVGSGAQRWLGRDGHAWLGRDARAAFGLPLDDFTHPADTLPVAVGRPMFARLDAPARPRRVRPAAPSPTKPIARDLDALAGGDAEMIANVRVARRLIDRGLPMLIVGETGTGKGLFARALHAASARAGKPFVAVNCAGIARDLIESELFGYRPGAFTGALSAGRGGLLLAANGGVLFLDEIGDMPVELQTRLLHALSEGAFTPVGATRSVELDLQVIAATLRDCEALVREGRFREDLYYRLAGATFALPPLRERADKLELIDQVFAEEGGVGLSAETQAALLAHEWPGNLRELRHVARFAVSMAGDRPVTPADLPRGLAGGGGERLTLVACLERTGGNVTAAAARLKMSRSTLHRKMQKLGIGRAE